MPSFITARFLLTVIIAGSAIALTLLLVTVASRILRGILGRRLARLERGVRPMVLAVADGQAVPPELVALGGARGRAAERVIFGYLSQLRGEAADQLAEVLRRRGAVDRLLRRTHSSLAYRRAAAAEQLGLVASPQAETRLTELVTGDHSLEVRIVAIRALGKAGSAGAAVTLLHSLSRADPVPEGVVASALLEIGPEAVPALREALAGKRAGGRRQRAMAANVLGLLDDMGSWPGLVANVASGDLEVRISAVRALGRLSMPQAADTIAACLRPSEDPALRAVAARALGLIGDPHTAPALAACLGDPDYWVAHNAAAALASMGGAGLAELSRAASGQGSAAGHARDALARRALAEGEMPPIPAAVPAVTTAAAAPVADPHAGLAPAHGGRA
jgi:HEAT repeat protein